MNLALFTEALLIIASEVLPDSNPVVLNPAASQPLKVSNLTDAIKKLQKNNFFVYGSDMDGKDCREVSYADKKVLVIGNEGKGISPIIEKNCDEMIKIAMKGNVNSLNASVAGALLIYKMGGLI